MKQLLYDAYELHAVREEMGSDGFCEPDYEITTQTDLDEANEHAHEEPSDNGVRYFWTVYGHRPEYGVTAISDFIKLEDAEALKAHLETTLKAYHALKNLVDRNLIKDVCGDHFLEACEAVGVDRDKKLEL